MVGCGDVLRGGEEMLEGILKVWDELKGPKGLGEEGFHVTCHYKSVKLVRNFH